MKRNLLILLISLFAIKSFAQLNYQPGHFIKNDGEKVTCLIKNKDWKVNPDKFDYKISANDPINNIGIDSVVQFEIFNSAKYVRKTVDVDTSGTEISNYSFKKEPLFREKTVFLKILLEGKASLYQYDDGSLKLFYQHDLSQIKQLVKKSYYTSENTILVNNEFRNQLWRELKCPEFTMESFGDLQYRTNEILDVFIKYNNCLNSAYTSYKKQTQKGEFFNLNIQLNVNRSSVTINNNYYKWKYDFGSKINFGIGTELEFIAPFYNKKWAFTLQPHFRYFKGEDLNNGTTSIDYKAIDIPFGIKHYYHWSSKSSFFLTGLFSFNYVLGSSEFVNSNSSLVLSNSTNFAVGAGYNRKKRYNVELRYNFNRDILLYHLTWSSKYNNLAVVFNYNLL